jgi:DNA-binding transcriptional ArsR family regulator
MNATPLSDKMLDLIARRFRMLGEPFRLRILQELQSGEKTVNELVDALEGNQPNVSKHLQLLHEAGLVGRRREGNSIFYAISDPMVFKLCDLVCRSEAQRTRQEFHHWSGIATQSRTTIRR